MEKTIETIIKPPHPHFVGDGFRVHNFIPSTYPLDMKRMDPFILMDYNSKYYFSPTETPRGVGVHPHRGFETVTIAYQGKIAHHDSNGGGGVIEQGDVQWITAGSGVLHKEYHEKSFSKKGGDFQMAQLWVNLPAKHKMTSPKYQAISKNNLSKHQLDGDSGYIEVIAGNYKNTQGKADTFSEIHMMNAKLNANGSAEFSFPAEFNTCVLVVEGEIEIQNQKILTDHFVLFENNGEDFEIKADKDAVALVLSGQPLNEPIAAQDSFVMNTKAEIHQAIKDFTNGKFGHLE
ncbi:pirin family protein [Flavobacterium sp. CS20]|uniref:pirin family protein n=1 Tax=Flavobacterium sp. CS20 TaxID=2775246 RepID=UPI001B3A76E4|nr:pirin family protein [Flavobacterium sp. CS20]QTY25909.1 pirin family protein [Flavobacterium sp. CS20]